MALVSLAINPVPSGAMERTVTGYDGLKLRAALWHPTRGPARGTMVIVPGRGEFIEKYFEVIADLRRRGFAVAIADLRGQGGSARKLADRRRGHVLAFTEYDRDLSVFMRDVVMAALPPPYVALGHSLGGNILLRGAQREDSPFTRMIVVSPMIEIHDTQLGVRPGLARIYAEAMCLMGLSTVYVRGGGPEAMEMRPFSGNRLTSDEVRYARNRAVLERSPELALGSPTNGWLRAALRSCALLTTPDYGRYVSVPMLLYSASADTVVKSQAIEDFAADVKLAGLIRIPGARHEILQENDSIRQRFWAAFDAYLDVAVPPRLQEPSPRHA